MIPKIVAAFSTSAAPRLFLFPGQGVQEVGMFSALPESDTREALALAGDLLGLDLAEIASLDKGKLINQTEITQPLLLLSHLLHFKAQGTRPASVRATG